VSSAIRRLIACAFLLAATVSPAAAVPLPAPVTAALVQAGVPAADVAVVVLPADGGEPTVSWNAARPMSPGSLIKLVTAYAALRALGPAYRWRTEALAGTALRDGALAGDLYLRGAGDPSLTVEQLWLLAKQLRAAGLRHIAGDLVLDRGRFAPPPHDPGAFDGEPLGPYNVGADALLVGFNSIAINLAAARGRVESTAALLPDRVEIANLLKPAEGPCGDWKDAVRVDLFRHAGGPARLVLTGSLAGECGERVLQVALPDHDLYLEGMFRRLWREAGGTIGGTVREGPAPEAARPLAYVDSPPLAQLLRDMNKLSNNAMARQVLLTLGAEHGAQPAREEDGARAVRVLLQQDGLDFPELVIENGSGLSRRERVSAGSLARLLAAAWAGPLMPEFAGSLAIAGVDGTARSRLAGTEAAGRAHLKTGSLRGVRGVAGYVLDRTGRRWIVVFIANHPDAAATPPAQDALLRWVHDGPE
jgi:D-alanyl-D-alanine carboxypeptidase/D-alanyl-D-alanine-endopeptidase (penicillin-binding protein 4)